MRELFLFVRPPRALWPFNGPSSAFWPPLAFASLAAALRGAISDIDVGILDCPALHMGWKSLGAQLDRRRPRYVGIGEEAVSAAEGLRLAAMAHSLGATVIAGGCTFGNLAREVLSTGLVGVVVQGEGEATIVELVRALREKNPLDALATVNGISFVRGGEAVSTARRALIEDLDDLPMPAYDLLPVERYGQGSLNHPDLATIEHSRGCTGSCGFCVLWRQMGREGAGGVRPCYRTKSPERVMDEIRILTGRYGRRYLCWVDPCFNADAGFLDSLAARMLEAGIRIGQNAWVRGDYLQRDEQSGLLKRLVQSGLNEIFVGIERVDSDGLVRLERGCDSKVDLAALREITERHPSLYVVGSFIYGLPGDSWRTIKAMRDATIDSNIDMAFYIPLTGLPGTPFWDAASWEGSGENLKGMNFLTAPGPDSAHIRELTRLLAISAFVDLRPRRIAYTWRTLTARDPRKRRMNWRLVWRGLSFALRQAASGLAAGGTNVMKVPEWYEK